MYVCVRLCVFGGSVAKSSPTLAILWTVARQAPLSVEFSRQEYWSWLTFPSPGDFPTQGSNTGCPHSGGSLAGGFFTDWAAREAFSVSPSVMSESLQPHGLKHTRLLSPWNSPGKSTGVGCHFLLQGISLTQGSNPGLPHSRQTL